jgi:hypothetical protein
MYKEKLDDGDLGATPELQEGGSSVHAQVCELFATSLTYQHQAAMELDSLHLDESKKIILDTLAPLVIDYAHSPHEAMKVKRPPGITNLLMPHMTKTPQQLNIEAWALGMTRNQDEKIMRLIGNKNVTLTCTDPENTPFLIRRTNQTGEPIIDRLVETVTELRGRVISVESAQGTLTIAEDNAEEPSVNTPLNVIIMRRGHSEESPYPIVNIEVNE